MQKSTPMKRGPCLVVAWSVVCLAVFSLARCTTDVIPIADYGEAGEGFSGVYCEPLEEYFVVWHDSVFLTTGGNKIRAIDLSPDGDVLVHNRILLEAEDPIVPSPLGIIFDEEQNQYFMAWTENEYSPRIMGTFVSLDGVPGAPFLIAISPEIGHVLGDLAWNDVEREYLAVMGHEFAGAGTNPALAQRISADGQLLGDPFPVSQASEGQCIPGYPKAAYNPEANQYLVAYANCSESDPYAVGEVYGRIYEYDGTPAGDWFTILSSSQQVWGTDLVCAYLPQAGHYVLYAQFYHNLSLPINTYGQRVSSEGALIGTPFIVFRDLERVFCHSGCSSPPPTLVANAETEKYRLVFNVFNGTLVARGLQPDGLLGGKTRILGLTYFVRSEVDTYPLDHHLLIPDAQAQRALALWTRFNFSWDWNNNLSGLIVDLN